MPSKRTFLRIINETSSPFVIRVENVDSYDWDNSVGPRSLNNRVIEPRNRVEERLGINSFATANLYTLIFCFNERTVLCFRIDQGIAAGRKESYNDYIPKGVTTLASMKPAALVGLQLATAAADFVHACVAHQERGVFNITGNAPVRVDHRVEGETLVIIVRPM